MPEQFSRREIMVALVQLPCSALVLGAGVGEMAEKLKSYADEVLAVDLRPDDHLLDLGVTYYLITRDPPKSFLVLPG